MAALGPADPGSLRAATDGLGNRWEVIAPIEELEAVAAELPDWSAEPGQLFELPAGWEPPRSGRPAADVRALDRADRARIDHLEGDLAREIGEALGHRPMVAAFVGGVAVSFCYACLETRTLWDVSIDTLEDYRRRGLAAAASLALIERLQERGKRPRWAALESNAASMGLARRLGFEPCGRIAVLYKG